MLLLTPSVILFVILRATAFTGAQGQSYTDEAVLQSAKSIDVAKLDSTLPSQRLEDWLLRGPARIDELNWYVSRDCDLKDPEPDADGDLPLCVNVGFRRGNITGFGLLRVGTLKHGVSGQPAFQYLDILNLTSSPPVGAYAKLSDFPGYLEANTTPPDKMDFCEVVRNPANYDRKLLSFEATIQPGFHSLFLYSPSCPSNEGFDASTQASLPDGWESQTNGKKLSKVLKHRRPAKVQLVGVFRSSVSRGLEGQRFTFRISQIDSVAPDKSAYRTPRF